MATTSIPPPPELDWLKLREDMEDGAIQETFTQRLKRKCMSEPLVPIGCGGTVAALTYGIWCFRSGNSQWSQYMMRTRVVAQGFTILVAVLGMTATAAKKS